MSRTEREDELVLTLLDRMNETWSGETSVEEDASEETLIRLYTEILGVLPAALPPIRPRPSLRRELLAQVAGQRQAAEAPGPQPPVSPPPPEGPGRGTGGGPVSRWLLPLAAALVVALLGLGGWMFARLESRTEAVTRLAGELVQVQGAQQDLAGLQQELRVIRSRLELVTSPGVEVCTLRAVGEDPVMPAARGILYVSADRQRWYLSLQGLERAPSGRAYQLWFHSAEGPVSAGTFEAVSRDMELSDSEMPPNMLAVSVTLEPEGGTGRPSGPQVLYGDEVMQIL